MSVTSDYFDEACGESYDRGVAAERSRIVAWLEDCAAKCLTDERREAYADVAAAIRNNATAARIAESKKGSNS